MRAKVTLTCGDVVEGTVVYVRNAPPTYSKPGAYSILLDTRKNDVGYTGSIFPAGVVEILKD